MNYSFIFLPSSSIYFGHSCKINFIFFKILITVFKLFLYSILNNKLVKKYYNFFRTTLQKLLAGLRCSKMLHAFSFAGQMQVTARFRLYRTVLQLLIYYNFDVFI